MHSNNDAISTAAQLTPASLRAAIRSGAFTGNTSGLAAGFVQCNIVILPAAHAGDFTRFCQRNPKPCPLIYASEPGATALPALGDDIDIRTDVPGYCVFENGKQVCGTADIRDLWRSDFVTFALGCSFSFEEALTADGLDVRNVSEQRNVPMYRTSIPCQSAGVFSSNMVVSMRPFNARDAIRAIQICTRFPSVHGAPIHLGKPELIGISDIHAPDFGEAVTINDDEFPVFWACGVTPQLALERAALPFAITHSPGHMLVTDLRNSQLAVL
ncbi:MAG: hypothetical protein CR978_00495 [Gammaproteobacteria bacterium]|nr:MAG: hypothetical protein CR978_00495 [Gammaproteobacteria bacterium]